MANATDNIEPDIEKQTVLVDRSGKRLPDYLQVAVNGGAHPLKIWRRHRGLAMGELARSAGTTTEIIFNMERFNEAPDDDLVDIIADILDAHPDALFLPD
ncbi:MAG: XRE family transcriptional regulator [Alphaproteobacteria bacterium]|nr:MAG: XRE family transcriptional regulator [Alphaproteobacteria bacterium]